MGISNPEDRDKKEIVMHMTRRAWLIKDASMIQAPVSSFLVENNINDSVENTLLGLRYENTAKM